MKFQRRHFFGIAAPRSARAARRRAAIMMSVLVSIGVVLALFVAWTRTLVIEQRAVEAQQRRVQGEYLARSGLERAEAQLAMSAGYQGETWRIEPASLGRQVGAAVVIRVETLADRPTVRQVEVQARVPEQGVHAVRITRRATIVLKTGGEAS
jgi:hypothetical protein